jgi:tripartite-type tricarboxylate transporter receptor subunit TctC
MKVDLPRAIFHFMRGALFLLLLGPAYSLSAEEYPTRPIKLIVPFSVGGDADVIGRVLAENLGSELKQSIIVENVTGAGGNIGVERVTRSEPDGYTLLLAPMGVLSVNPTLYKGLKFDVSKDLVPISLAYETGHLVVVNPSLQARSLAELAELARSKPGQLSFGSGGVGTSTHLYGEVFKMTAKVDALHVPYRGNGQALNDVIAGQIQMMFPQIASAASQAASGLVRPLAVTTANRSPLLPDVPTVVEAGMPELAGTSWGGIMAPRGTPPDVVARLNSAIVKVVNDSATRARFETIGINARTSTPDELGHLIDAELVRWRRVITAANLTLN